MRYLLIILFLFSIKTSAQKITGQITDDKKSPLSFADVMVLDSLDNILAYSITNSNGEYFIEFNTQEQKIRIQANFIGYYKKVKEVNVDSSIILNFQLKQRNEKIRTVNVKAKQPVQIEKNDTTIFNLERIINGSEEVVEDILKKLPGMEVDPGGILKYKGQEISKMLLEGDDLFQGNYTLGSKNIQAYQIKGIEAIENYQDNPLLRGIENSDEVVINLKFKKEINLSNTVDLAYGINNKYSADYKNIAISKPLKAFTYLNSNNLALNQSAYSYNPSITIQNGNSTSFANEGYLSTGKRISLLKSRKSNFNKALSGSVNLKPKIGNNLDIRLNLDFLSDNARDNTREDIRIEANNPIYIEEEIVNMYKPRFVKGDLNLSKYLGRNIRIENVTKLSLLNNLHSYSGFVNQVEQEFNSQSKSGVVYNETELTNRLSKRTGLKFNFIYSLSSTPEELNIIPGINTPSQEYYYAYNQMVKNEKHNIQASTGFFHKNNKDDNLNLGIKFTKLKRDLFAVLHDSLKTDLNDIDFRLLNFESYFSYRLKRKELEITPQASYRFVKYLHTKKNGKQFLFDGSVRFNYRPSSRHSFLLNLKCQQIGLDDNKIYTSYILSTNRVRTKHILDYGVIERGSFYLRYDYLNPIKFHQLNMGISGISSNKSYLSNYDISQNVTYVDYYLSNNNSKAANLWLLYQVPTRWLYGKIRLTSQYNYLNFASILNGETKYNVVRTKIGGINWESLVIWYFVLSNDFSVHLSDYGSHGNNSLSNRFELIFQKENLRFASQLRLHVPAIGHNYSETLWNVKLQYRFRKLLFTTEGVNLLNSRERNVVNQNDFSSIVRYSEIQQRYFLFGISFKF